MAKKEVVEEVQEVASQPEPEVSFVSKLSAANAGRNPRAVLTLPEGQTSLEVATIMGICTGFKIKDDPITGTTHYPLTGQFQAIHPETGERTQSGVLYLPEGIHDTYLSAAKKLEGDQEFRFAIKLNSVKAGNAAGRSYQAVNLLKPKSVSALDELMGEVLGTGKQLTTGA